MIVLPAPFVDDSFGLINSKEPLSIEHFSAKRSIEAYVVAILTRTARIVTDWFNPHFGEPCLKCPCNELRAIVGAEELRLSMSEKKTIVSFRLAPPIISMALL